MNEFGRREIDGLVERIANEEWGVPVRAMEALLARGEDAVEPLLRVLREHRTPPEDAEPRFWPVVVLGELRSPASVPALAEMLREAPEGHTTLLLAAAEALAKIGPAALPALRELSRTGSQRRRHWAYYAAGRMRDGDAFDLLVSALEADPEMLDVVSMALLDQGRKDAVEPLLRALERAEPWQRPEMEEALVGLHAEDREPAEPEDWRLRYRPKPGVGFLTLNWAMVSSVIRHDEEIRRRRRVPASRGLEEILARAPQDRPERCECCDVPTWEATGVPVCPQTAAGVPVLQARMLEHLSEEGLDDLFDVLDELETRLELDGDRPVHASRAALRRWEDQRTGLLMLRNGCIWLVEQGIESAAPGIARFGAETRRAAALYGEFDTSADEPSRRPVVVEERVGRNEPCPCGSGRKFKKCCGG